VSGAGGARRWLKETGEARVESMNGGGNNQQLPTAYLAKSEVTTLALGSILNQRYQIDKVLGVGGMGAVYRVRDLRFPDALKYCALKEMIAKFTNEADQRTRLANFQREANLLASLSHPAIPSVHDFFVEHERAYLVLEYIEGRNLEVVLQETHGMLGEQVVAGWAIQLCDVLQYLHSHTPPIIFRDLKPSNVMLTPQNQIVLIDFGIAKAFQEGQRGTMVGTEGYSPPEQYRGEVDRRSDIYSLGALMHHLLTGSDPRFQTPFTFGERPPSLLNPTVSAGMEGVVMRCLEYEPDARFHDALEVRGALASALSIVPLGTGHFRVMQTGTPRTWIGGAPAGATSGIAGTGLLWKFQTGDEVRSSPVVHDGTLYIGSYDAKLYALEARTGRQQWAFTTEGGICGTPAVWRNYVLIGSEDFNVYGVQAANGQEAWTYRTWEQVRSSPRVHGEALYIGSDDGFMHALEPRNGRPLWKFRAWRPVRSSAAYAEGLVYFGSDDERIYAVDALTGQEKWRFAAMGGITSSPAIGNGLVYVGSMDFLVYGIDAKMGWVAWRERTGNFVISSPCVVGERVYVGSVDQHLYCFDGKSGRVLWKFRTGGQITSSPTVAEGVAYVGGVDGSVYAVDAATGQQKWQFQTGGAVPSSPVVAEGVVYVGSMDGMVYAMRA
jgi:outer membrane protein assembly factor BamB/tRNA A-37 threonylcarbamoyl transferase component Bud32